MKYKAPLYIKKFKCIAGECRDSCCVGWEIFADEKTREKYMKMEGPLGEDIRASLTDDGCFCLREDGRCPHLLENGLCRIICECGEGALCDICREHPRFYNYYGGLCEWGISLACESAARLILDEADPLCFSIEERKMAAEEETDEELFSFLLRQRDAMMHFSLDKKRSLFEKLYILEQWGVELQDYIDNTDKSKKLFTFSLESYRDGEFFTQKRWDAYKELLSSLDPLAQTWKERCELFSIPSVQAKNNALFSRLLAYFIYRYFLTYALTGDVTAPMGLSLFGTSIILALCEYEGRVTPEEIAEAAKDFSKEVECSEENRDAVLDAFSAFAF